MTEHDDDVLAQLGALEREYDDRFPHEWEDVVRGDRDAQEVAQLRLAAGDDAQEVQALAELLGSAEGAEHDAERDAERDAWVQRIAGALAEDDGSPRSSPDDVAEASVVSLPERRATKVWVPALVGLLMAAALVLWLRPDRQDDSSSEGLGRPLPSYGLTVRNSTVHELRSDDGQPEPGSVHRYRADTLVHWTIAPQRSAPASTGLRVLAEPSEAPTTSTRRLLDPEATVSERGVLEVRGRFDEQLGLPPGTWSLRLIVGAPPPADLAAYDAGGPWTVVEPAYVIQVLTPESDR
ncbi:MAG: hypothetical protein AB1Z98_39055 [Nannocystaceae bacterium]